MVIHSMSVSENRNKANFPLVILLQKLSVHVSLYSLYNAVCAAVCAFVKANTIIQKPQNSKRSLKVLLITAVAIVLLSTVRLPPELLRELSRPEKKQTAYYSLDSELCPFLY